MVHASCSGLLIAETASQLVLGTLFCAMYFAVRRQVEWLGFGIACLGLASCSWAVCALGTLQSTSIAAMAFTVGSTLAVVMIAFALAWLTRRHVLRRLAWFAAASGVVWQMVLGHEFPPSTRAQADLPISGSGSLGSAASALFLAFLALVILVSLVLFCRGAPLPRTERNVIVSGVGLFALGLVGDGPVKLLFATIPPLLSHAGLAMSLMLTVSLVLYHKRVADGAVSTELRLATSIQDLTTANASVERLQRELGAKKQLAVVGELAAAIAHEVRNPLAIIMNAAAGLRRPTIGNEDRTTLLSILDEETARLNRLVTDLLRFARPVIIKRSSVSILELARRAEGRLEDKHSLRIDIPDQQHLKSVEADANLLRLVFDNLVSNAFQAMPEGGTVEILVSEAAKAEERFVRIDIVDKGHGMDEQVLARAIDPFYTTRPSGTGLGLPIVQRIVEAHGGDLEIHSSLGQGTRVSLFLPLLSPGAAAGSNSAVRS